MIFLLISSCPMVERSEVEIGILWIYFSACKGGSDLLGVILLCLFLYTVWIRNGNMWWDRESIIVIKLVICWWQSLHGPALSYYTFCWVNTVMISAILCYIFLGYFCTTLSRMTSSQAHKITTAIGFHGVSRIFWIFFFFVILFKRNPGK